MADNDEIEISNKLHGDASRFASKSIKNFLNRSIIGGIVNRFMQDLDDAGLISSEKVLDMITRKFANDFVSLVKGLDFDLLDKKNKDKFLKLFKKIFDGLRKEFIGEVKIIEDGLLFSLRDFPDEFYIIKLKYGDTKKVIKNIVLDTDNLFILTRAEYQYILDNTDETFVNIFNECYDENNNMYVFSYKKYKNFVKDKNNKKVFDLFLESLFGISIKMFDRVYSDYVSQVNNVFYVNNKRVLYSIFSVDFIDKIYEEVGNIYFMKEKYINILLKNEKFFEKFKEAGLVKDIKQLRKMYTEYKDFREKDLNVEIVDEGDLIDKINIKSFMYIKEGDFDKILQHGEVERSERLKIKTESYNVYNESENDIVKSVNKIKSMYYYDKDYYRLSDYMYIVLSNIANYKRFYEIFHKFLSYDTMLKVFKADMFYIYLFNIKKSKEVFIFNGSKNITKKDVKVVKTNIILNNILVSIINNIKNVCNSFDINDLKKFLNKIFIRNLSDLSRFKDYIGNIDLEYVEDISKLSDDDKEREIDKNLKRFLYYSLYIFGFYTYMYNYKDFRNKSILLYNLQRK